MNKGNRERIVDEAILNVGKDMFEAAVAIKDQIGEGFEKNKQVVSELIIRLIEGARIYSNVLLEDHIAWCRYNGFLDEAVKDISICQIATKDVAHLAASFGAKAIKNVAQVTDDEILTYVSAAVAWDANVLVCMVDDKSSEIDCKDSADIAISRIKQAIELTIREVERCKPTLSCDLEWQRKKRDLLTQLFVVEENCIYIVEENEESYTLKKAVIQAIEVIQDKFTGILDKIHA